MNNERNTPKYKVQERFLWVFWLTHYEFYNIDNAKAEIELLKNKRKKEVVFKSKSR